MPPRLPTPQGLRTLSLCLRPAARPATPSLQPFIQTANISRKEKKKRMKQDPYGWAQAQQRKAVNVKRQDELKEERDAAWGSPVHGIPTPFVESFDSAGQAPLSTPPTDEEGNPLVEPHSLPTSPHLRNHLLKEQEILKAISESELLTRPLERTEREPVDPEEEMKAAEAHAKHHAKAMVALQRITDLNQAGGKDRKHANIRRCIEEFGRHNTDKTLGKEAAPFKSIYVEKPEKTKRAGPDTGSSEVQIAILTAKIRALALALEGPKGNKDKHNKANLRKLCHRRQALLRYMERKERGSGRWQHMLETLGLTPATWKEQISI